MGPRILIAEDDESVRILVMRILERHGFTVDGAANGEVAIERLKAGEYDSLVLDLMMPRVDGLGVIEFMIANKPHMVEKTVVVTAFTQTAARNELNSVCRIVRKPFELTALIDAVNDCVAA
jgi:DNA-binding response OmpR family regulator